MFSKIIASAVFSFIFVIASCVNTFSNSKIETTDQIIQKYYNADDVKVETSKKGLKQYTVIKTIDGSLYGLMKETALDIQSTCRTITEENVLPKDSIIKFVSLVGLVDKYGKSYTENAIEFTFSASELYKVANWNNLLPQNVLDLADSMTATPIGWEIMARQLKRDPDDYKDYVGILERMARAK